jgi:uncharacterized alkaline shock family protein YloU
MERSDSSDGSLGRVTISTHAIAQLVGHTAAECYGVVGMAARGGKVGRLLARDRPERGIDVSRKGDGLALTLHIVVEHGLNLAEVAATVRSHVAYEVGRLTGLRVESVEVHIGDVRRSA